MKYHLALTKHGLTVDQLSSGLKGKLKKLEKLNTALAEAKNDLLNPKLTDPQREELRQEIAEGQEGLQAMDLEITDHINKWAPKREEYAEKGKNLQAGRKAKKQPQPAAAVVDPPTPEPPSLEEPAPSPTPAAVVDPPTPEPQTTPATPTEVEVTPKKEKDGFGWGWLAATVAVVASVVIGVKLYNER